MPQKRYRQLTFVGLLAESAGLLGLYCGVSILISVEIFYFLALRPSSVNQLSLENFQKGPNNPRGLTTNARNPFTRKYSKPLLKLQVILGMRSVTRVELWKRTLLTKSLIVKASPLTRRPLACVISDCVRLDSIVYPVFIRIFKNCVLDFEV